jgi:hypothetical protein
MAALAAVTTLRASDSKEITADRAWQLAQTYYMRYFGLWRRCEVALHITLGGPVHYGYSGEPRGSIRVDRHTGSVSYRGYPTLSAKRPG